MTIPEILDWVLDHYDNVEPNDTLSVINGWIMRSWWSSGRLHRQYLNTVEGIVNEINYHNMRKEAGL